jgi:hypothetical protein
VGFFCNLAIPNNKEEIMASLIKAFLRLKPVKGFGADLPHKARKRGVRVNSSLRRDKAIAKARRAEAKASKLVARATSQLKLAADTKSAREDEARRRAMAKAAAEAKAKADAKAAAEAKAKADAKAAAIAKAKSTLILPGQERPTLVPSAEGIALASQLKLHQKPAAPVLHQKPAAPVLLTASLRRSWNNSKLATALSRQAERLTHATAVATARPVRVCGVAGTGRK